MKAENESEIMHCYIKDDIMFGIYLCSVITLDVAKEVVRLRTVINEGKAYPGLADIRNVKTVTTEARIFFGKPENNLLISAGALIVNNIFQETVGNIYLYINKPPIPSKLFTKEDDAVKWLNTFK